jgi:hypothetical protein
MLQNFPKQYDFYPNFAQKYEKLFNNFNAKVFNDKIKEIIKALDKKSKNLVTEFSNIKSFDFRELQTTVDRINAVIEEIVVITHFWKNKEKLKIKSKSIVLQKWH